MCRISIGLKTRNGDGSSIVSANGRYRKFGSTFWNPTFNVNLLLPFTPNIIEEGEYELQVNVTNNVGQTSLWSPSTTFNVISTCGDIVDAPTNSLTTSCGISTYTRFGGNGEISVTAISTISWTATIEYLTTGQVGWVSVSTFSSTGQGDGTLNYSVSPSVVQTGGESALRRARIVITNDTNPSNTRYCLIQQNYTIGGDLGGDDGGGLPTLDDIQIE